MKNYFLYSHCIPVRGYGRSIIYDLGRNTYYYIPNSLYDILDKHLSFPVKRLMNFYKMEDREIIKEYFDFLHNKDLIYESNDAIFLSLEEGADTPTEIENIIIDTYLFFKQNYTELKRQIENLGVNAIQLRFFGVMDFDIIREAVHIMGMGRHSDLHLVISYGQLLQCSDFVKNIVNSAPLLSYIKIYSAPFLRRNKYLNVDIELTKDEILDESSCGLISRSNFYVNSKLYFESQKYNNCLYKKISVDKEGWIKNCPSMKKNYGHINDVELISVASSKSFTSYWNINKDKIDTCKNCEYRYMCIDCRAYRKSDDLYSCPLKCTYDIINCKWE